MNVIDAIKGLLTMGVLVTIIIAMILTASLPIPSVQHERFDPEFSKIILESADCGWQTATDNPPILHSEGGGLYGSTAVRQVSLSRREAN